MKAAVLRDVPGELTIEDVELAEPGPGEVLLKTAAAGLCHSDLHFMEGKFPTPTPAVLGHESAGVVEAVGPGVTYVQPGDHVITCLSVYCGNCEPCLTGHLSVCANKAETARGDDEAPRISQNGERIDQFLHMSSFGEHMLVHEHGVVKIRKDMPLDRAALIGCGVTTGLGAVFNTARVEVGSTVAVLGAGGIGLNAIQGARIAGARRIIAIDMVDTKLDIAKEFGATDVINASEDPVAQVHGLLGGGVDYSFECIGMKQTAEQSFNMLGQRGTATVVGMIPMGVNIELHGIMLMVQESKIQGSNMGSNRFRVDMPRYIDLYMQGRLKLDELVSARITLEEINAGFDAMKTGEVARSVIVFDD
ncbi:MAG: Zn-dependent alcohol dehydrogenase [Actinomycetia bacterium]|nr:Zn-dependent alcohol dehydrogenase [Actinomycetes bacterium]MCP3910453.1 Zn-dependent alcohol dehydrogenase [Actinomycetes bacterium]MCP4087215.1 Zn-dependent alcohol dehydrogenase [Actinomycetes bacterium]